MARHLFIAQQTLDAWVEQDKVEFRNNVMTIKADGRSFKMVEAVRFVKVEGGEEDKPGLLGRVKTNDQLKEMGAERYRDSVLYQEIAYQVQEGFIGEVFLKPKPVAEPVQAPHARTQPHVPAAPLQPKKEPSGPASPPKESQPPAASAAKPQEKKKKTEEELTDEELLVKFLLNNL